LKWLGLEEHTNMTKSIDVKWAGPNTPYISIERTGERVYPTKREILAMLQEIQEFVEYYKDNFSEGRLDYTDVDYTDLNVE